MSGPTAALPLWAAISVALLLVLAGLLSFLGALGLLRLPNFYQRVHAPSISTTLGTGCMLLASMLHATWQEGRPVLHELSITVLVLLTAPVVAMLLMRAAVYRDLHVRRQRSMAAATGQPVPSADGEDTPQAATEAAQEKGLEVLNAAYRPEPPPGKP